MGDLMGRPILLYKKEAFFRLLFLNTKISSLPELQKIFQPLNPAARKSGSGRVGSPAD